MGREESRKAFHLLDPKVEICWWLILDAAIKQYKKASALDPADPVTFSNISAALFEVGYYTRCYNVVQGTLRLVPREPNFLTHKLISRSIKSCLYGKKVDQARKALEMLDSGHSEYGLLAEATKQVGTIEAYSPRDSHSLWRYFANFSRYRSVL